MSATEQQLLLPVTSPDITEAVRGVEPSSDGLVNVWIRYDSEAADFVRAHEAAIFPEVPDLLNDQVEQQCMFSAIVDVAEERVLHASRMSGPLIRKGNGGDATGSGFVIIDELIAENDSFTVEAFFDRYDEQTRNLSFSIETNFRIGERRTLASGARVAHLGYLALFRLVERVRPRGATTLIFGGFNDATVRSLNALAIDVAPLSGIPEQRPSDTVYRPSVIPSTDETSVIFEALESVALPEAYVGDPDWAREVLAMPPVGVQIGAQIGAQIGVQRSGSQGVPAQQG
jgi:hypothetical protein